MLPLELRRLVLRVVLWVTERHQRTRPHLLLLRPPHLLLLPTNQPQKSLLQKNQLPTSQPRKNHRPTNQLPTSPTVLMKNPTERMLALMERTPTPTLRPPQPTLELTPVLGRTQRERLILIVKMITPMLRLAPLNPQVPMPKQLLPPPPLLLPPRHLRMA
jgi:hypothetical protein